MSVITIWLFARVCVSEHVPLYVCAGACARARESRARLCYLSIYLSVCLSTNLSIYIQAGTGGLTTRTTAILVSIAAAFAYEYSSNRIVCVGRINSLSESLADLYGVHAKYITDYIAFTDGRAGKMYHARDECTPTHSFSPCACCVPLSLFALSLPPSLPLSLPLPPSPTSQGPPLAPARTRALFSLSTPSLSVHVERINSLSEVGHQATKSTGEDVKQPKDRAEEPGVTLSHAEGSGDVGDDVAGPGPGGPRQASWRASTSLTDESKNKCVNFSN